MSLRCELRDFLDYHGIEYYGVVGPIRGSKHCSVYIKKSDLDQFRSLDGKGNGYHNFYFSRIYEFEDSVQFNVSCIKR